MPLFEFLIKQRPLSLQTRNRNNLQAWKNFVRQEASKTWNDTLIEEQYLHVVIVYLSDDSPPDVDNIVKPILDALVGLIYEDDVLIADVESHRRYLSDGIEITNLPELLQSGVLDGEECVYIKIETSQTLENYL
ncbi:MAG: RusA family crossover junction endodeoxyribonuclease [Methylococcaceae bacterium]|nr:RusA family crossover junction endodeoxyribonuclease [Methylococcaceae bacterium]